jgi:pimeloyl-ACP methyl ester carboxylesterase
MQVSANGIAVEVEDHGSPGGEPVLLIMGLGMQLLAWPDELVDDLVRRGLRVLRHDNRDAGLSTGFERHGVPNLPWTAMKALMHLPLRPPYTVADMAADAAGVLDALNLGSAHIVGASMGGMIAQHLAASHPDRVRSLTLIMTTSGARHLPRPSFKVQQALMGRPKSHDTDDVLAYLKQLMALIGSPAYPPEPQRFAERLRASVARAYRPDGTARQLAAILADGDRSHLLARIAAPTLIVHGEDDPLVPVAAAHDLARKITGAELDIIPGMGHDLPLELMPRLAAGIADNLQRAASTTRGA